MGTKLAGQGGNSYRVRVEVRSLHWIPRESFEPRSLWEEIRLRVESFGWVRCGLVVFVGRTEWYSDSRTQRLKELPKTSTVVVAQLVAGGVRPRVPVRQVRKVLRDERQVSGARGRAQPKGAGMHMRRAGRRDLGHEIGEVGRVVGDTGQDGHDVDADVDPGGVEARNGTDSCVGRRRTRLDEASKVTPHRDERQ